MMAGNVRLLKVFGALVLILSVCEASLEDVERIEEEGYYKKEHSLVQPYHGKCNLGLQAAQ